MSGPVRHEVLGILLAGLFEAERELPTSTQAPRPSGVFRQGASSGLSGPAWEEAASGPASTRGSVQCRR
jgi:hypothetical protein